MTDGDENELTLPQQAAPRLFFKAADGLAKRVSGTFAFRERRASPDRVITTEHEPKKGIRMNSIGIIPGLAIAITCLTPLLSQADLTSPGTKYRNASNRYKLS